MAYYDNPAGRLHELLRQLSEQNHNGPILAGWAAVLGVPRGDAIFRIGPILDLVRQIEEAVERTGEDALREPVARLRETWARPILTPDHAYKSQLANVLPDAEAMQTLALVSSQLHLLAPEGEVPDGDKRSDLMQQVRELVDAVEGAELPDEVKQAIAGRLIDVEKAIELIHIGGPDAVRRAMEAVMGAVVHAATTDVSAARSPSMLRVYAAIAMMWVVFTSGDEIQKNLEAWPKVIQEITSGEALDADANKNDDGSDEKRKPLRAQENPKTSD